ncbi:hypothetical protein TRIP_B200809 [uncultured Desulfatiglans sp.]|nr:hypothetical protein TRIP_B200809 [uncultured Desulfatiglans sp.]
MPDRREWVCAAPGGLGRCVVRDDADLCALGLRPGTARRMQGRWLRKKGLPVEKLEFLSMVLEEIKWVTNLKWMLKSV